MNRDLFIVEAQISIFDAMKQLDENGQRLLVVVSSDTKKMLGVVTDGDIRRYILKSGDLRAEIHVITNTTPILLKRWNLKKGRQLFQEKSIMAIPVVDKEHRLESVMVWEDVFKKEKAKGYIGLPVVIMAGGKGTRLYPYTNILPKPLIPIGDIPIVERIMNRFGVFGCQEFYLVINHKKNMIKAYFNELDKQSIHYIEESKPLGTAGGLSKLVGQIDQTFIVTNCDVLIDGDYTEILRHHKQQGNKITIISSVKHEVLPYGVIELNENQRIKSIKEKPAYQLLVNTGVYILEASVLADIPKDTFYHMTDLIARYLDEGKEVGIFPISDDAWMDMGQIGELEKMVERLDKHD